MKKIISLLFLFVFYNSAQALDLSSPICQTDKEPQFESFGVNENVKSGEIAGSLVFLGKRTKKYKTVIANDANRGVNFSGHFRVVTWGCGTDCHQFAIINIKDRTVFMSNFIELIAGAMGNDEDRISFRPDSSLIVFNGSINDEVEGKFFFKWKSGRLFFLCRSKLIKDS